jgi:hypothetical protein
MAQAARKLAAQIARTEYLFIFAPEGGTDRLSLANQDAGIKRKSA